MRNESSHLLEMPLPGWTREKGRQRETQRESSGRVTKDEEIRTDQLETETKLNNRHPRCEQPFLSLIVSSLSIFQQFLPTSAVHSLIPVHAYLPVVLPHLQPQSLLLKNLVLLYVSLPPCV